MRIDLHTHSNRSDGTDSPTDLIQHAAEAGLDVVALTDHDVTVGWDEARAAANEHGIRFIGGIEISTEIGDHNFHLLAYEPDPTYAPLADELNRVLSAREARIPETLARLAAHGINLTIEDVRAQSTAAASLGRPHVADAMVATGQARDRDETFALWLAQGRPGYVHKYSIELHEAIKLVVAAGGKPVLAHPLARESADMISTEFFAELQELGLAGIEVDHLDHGVLERAQLRGIADDLGLVKTGSSDYHGTGKGPSFALGANMTDPEELEKLLGL